MEFSYSKSIKMVAALTIATVMSACASTPEPKIVEAPRAPEKPVFEKPEPLPAPKPVVTQQVEAPVFTQLPDNYVTPGSVDDFLATAGDRVFFGYDQSSLDTQARDVLRAQANWMTTYPQTIAVIGGHADERGTREYNLSLGEKRASAVKDFLVSQGVDPSRVTTVSYGKERPISGGSDEQSWAMNRNGHTAIVAGANS